MSSRCVFCNIVKAIDDTEPNVCLDFDCAYVPCGCIFGCFKGFFLQKNSENILIKRCEKCQKSVAKCVQIFR